MTTKIIYDYKLEFGNLCLDVVAGCLPTRIEIEQNEELEFLDVSLKMKMLTCGIVDERKYGDSYKTTLVFEIEGEKIEIEEIHPFLSKYRIIQNFQNSNKKDSQEIDKVVIDLMEWKSNLITEKITKILNDKYSEMMQELEEGYQSEKEKEDTLKFIQTH